MLNEQRRQQRSELLQSLSQGGFLMWRFMTLACVAIVAAMPTWSAAQERGPDEPRRDPIEARTVELPPRWIGAMCAPVDEVLRSQLAIESGLVILSVVPESPAALAGLKLHDVLTAIDGKPVERVTDLAEAVNAVDEGADITLEVRRGGTKQTVTVRPAARPDADVLRRFAMPGEPGRGRPADAEQMQAWAEKMRQNLPEGEARRMQEWVERMRRGEQLPFRMQMFGPGVVMQHAGGELPADVSVTIKKSGNKPAEVHVERGDEKWDVRADELDKLPAELRGPIGAMLGNMMPGNMAGGPHGVAFAVPGGAAGAATSNAGDIQIEIDGKRITGGPQDVAVPRGFVSAAEFHTLKEQVERLQHQIETLTAKPSDAKKKSK